MVIQTRNVKRFTSEADHSIGLNMWTRVESNDCDCEADVVMLADELVALNDGADEDVVA